MQDQPPAKLEATNPPQHNTHQPLQQKFLNISIIFISNMKVYKEMASPECPVP
jgi:hypothetical protein